MAIYFHAEADPGIIEGNSHLWDGQEFGEASVDRMIQCSLALNAFEVGASAVAQQQACHEF